MEEASKQLIRAVRGRRSQVALSRRLGYRSNTLADWEAGRRFPTAQVFLRACSACKVDISAAFSQFHPQAHAAVATWSTPALHVWLDAIKGGTSAVRLAARSGHSRYAVGRWLHGQAEPRLPDFLTLVEAATGRASDLVAGLVDIRQVPALFRDHQARSEARRLAFEQPYSAAILRLLEVPPQRKTANAAALAESLGITVTEVESALRTMQRASVIKRRRGTFVEVAPLTVDTRDEPERYNRLRAHWTDVARQRLEAPRDGDWFGYNVFALSEAELDEAREILRRAYREIRGLVAASSAPERAALLNMQLMTWQ